jgi:hypothetical protein
MGENGFRNYRVTAVERSVADRIMSQVRTHYENDGHYDQNNFLLDESIGTPTTPRFVLTLKHVHPDVLRMARQGLYCRVEEITI